jgi:heme/copper-type cytochrome/quinol oxidase subunit 2
MRKEWLARIIVTLGLVIALGIPAVGWWQHKQGTVLHARMAETGGWTPENLSVVVGEPLHLRLTSDDVTHGFAVGQMDRPGVDVIPGEMTDVTLVFDKPGKYTFYCTRWCSVNHWRMRGTIEVTDPHTEAEPAPVCHSWAGYRCRPPSQCHSGPNALRVAWSFAQQNHTRYL